jgi:Fe2+ or Zn2+ uptake regulation protein
MPEKKVYRVVVETGFVYSTEAENEVDAIVATRKWLETFSETDLMSFRSFLDGASVKIECEHKNIEERNAIICSDCGETVEIKNK